MNSHISLPAPASEFLIMSVKPCGKLVGFEWLEGHGLDATKQAEITALTKAQMFTGGALCLHSVIGLYEALEATHEQACSRLSGYQEKYGFGDTDESLRIDLDVDRASGAGLRARKWVTSFHAKTGTELARMIVGLIGKGQSPHDLNYEELNAIRTIAKGVKSAA